MSITDIIKGGGFDVSIKKKKMPQGQTEKRTPKESLVDYLDDQIAELERRGNLEPKYNPVKTGARKGAKIREITAWSGVDADGKREILLMCKNKKMYVNEKSAKANTGIYMPEEQNNYEGVLGYLKYLRDEFDKQDEDEFEPWTRNKKTSVVSKIVKG